MLGKVQINTLINQSRSTEKGPVEGSFFSALVPATRQIKSGRIYRLYNPI